VGSEMCIRDRLDPEQLILVLSVSSAVRLACEWAILLFAFLQWSF
jgi:hypothetical protein